MKKVNMWVGAVVVMLVVVAGTLALILAKQEGDTDVYGNYAGEWSNGYIFNAEVTDERIRVELDMDGMKALYWLGDVSYGNGTVMSRADEEALAGSLFGSGLSEKDFYHDGDILSFDFSIMGMSELVEMEKVD